MNFNMMKDTLKDLNTIWLSEGLKECRSITEIKSYILMEIQSNKNLDILNTNDVLIEIVNRMYPELKDWLDNIMVLV